ncbi:MAG: TatD DNase family protein [Frankiaceae bacterium]|nr:TatD DNase family protein [Frankiaceae bacterium]
MDVAVADAVAQARAVGIERMVTVGVDAATSRWQVETAEQYDGVYAAVAVHPNEAPAAGEADWAEIERLASHPKVVAVGETGLDHYRTGEDGRPRQEESFRRHIDIAKRTGKAVMIHDRDAHDEVMRVLDSEGAPDRVVFHCFSGDAAFARQCAERGYVMSFAGNITFKNADELRAAAAIAPAELILVETDAPFLTPMPYRGRPNAPYLVPLTVAALAAVRGEDVAGLADAISATANRTFGWA